MIQNSLMTGIRYIYNYKEVLMTLSDKQMQTPDKIYVNEFLLDLIPDFIKNKIKDLAIIKSAIEHEDADTIKKIGHNWKGVCSSYGFNYLGETGKQFEILAQNEDYKGLKLLIETLPEYLKNIQIEIIPDFETDTANKNETLF